jgi:hypothetical protein
LPQFSFLFFSFFFFFSLRSLLDSYLGELGLAVGAHVLVAVAAGQLVVAVQTPYHEQLLIPVPKENKTAVN